MREDGPLELEDELRLWSSLEEDFLLELDEELRPEELLWLLPLVLLLLFFWDEDELLWPLLLLGLWLTWRRLSS